jgi:ribosome-associated heat shock protein Hsp15
MSGVRMDKWIWAARFFKTRALASKACEMGRVLSNAVVAKAAREVRIGDFLQVRNEAGDFAIEVLALSEERGPAAVAQGLYHETEESKNARAKAAEERKARFAAEMAPVGRPSKRDRRVINKFRGR